MSYYFYVETNPKNVFWKRKNKIVYGCDSSVTHNYNKLFDAVLKCHPYDWEYKKTKFAKRKLIAGIKEIKINSENYLHLLPENGWGTIDGFLELLDEFLYCSNRFPNFYFKFSK